MPPLIRVTQATDVSSLTGRARTIMLGIQARAVTNTAILAGTAVLLLGLIGVVVYFGWFK